MRRSKFRNDEIRVIKIGRSCKFRLRVKSSKSSPSGMIRRRLVPFTAASTVSGDVHGPDGKKVYGSYRSTVTNTFQVGKIVASSSARGLAMLSLSSMDKDLRSSEGVGIKPFLPDWMKDLDLAKVHV